MTAHILKDFKNITLPSMAALLLWCLYKNQPFLASLKYLWIVFICVLIFSVYCFVAFAFIDKDTSLEEEEDND